MRKYITNYVLFYYPYYTFYWANKIWIMATELNMQHSKPQLTNTIKIKSSTWICYTIKIQAKKGDCPRRAYNPTIGILLQPLIQITNRKTSHYLYIVATCKGILEANALRSTLTAKYRHDMAVIICCIITGLVKWRVLGTFLTECMSIFFDTEKVSLFRNIRRMWQTPLEEECKEVTIL